MGNTDPDNTKQENKYEVKHQYEELIETANMQHAIINAMKCIRAIKDRIARPANQLANHLKRASIPRTANRPQQANRFHSSKLQPCSRFKLLRAAQFVPPILKILPHKFEQGTAETHGLRNRFLLASLMQGRRTQHKFYLATQVLTTRVRLKTTRNAHPQAQRAEDRICSTEHATHEHAETSRFHSSVNSESQMDQNDSVLIKQISALKTSLVSQSATLNTANTTQHDVALLNQSSPQNTTLALEIDLSTKRATLPDLYTRTITRVQYNETRSLNPAITRYSSVDQR
ncbi:hypothetical protein F511_35081 [Dorcoceras hygrometricum]|uniref:Uncharacterized protein n=1 Tax=Dorcoceras hygrometricum TaxID=472368 RepID=A0A2Z7APX9_9LAMI|nr:hypothetical protein F511_35081 [Dorcoceras hygrometricum]